MLRNVITVAFVLFAIIVSAEGGRMRKRTLCKTGKNSSVEPTVYERNSDVGVRNTPFFNLPVGGDYPQKMIMFNTDVYGSEDGLLSEDADDIMAVNNMKERDHKTALPFCDLPRLCHEDLAGLQAVKLEV